MKIEIDLEEVDTKGSIECGFRMEWLSAESEDLNISLDSGSGCGSPWIQVTAEEPGEKPRHFRYDMREFVKEIAARILE